MVRLHNRFLSVFSPTIFIQWCKLCSHDSRDVFQVDNMPIHTTEISGNWLDEFYDKLQHLMWPHHHGSWFTCGSCHLSPLILIWLNFWGVFWMRNCGVGFPPPKAISELGTFLQEEWLRIPVNVVRDLYLSIPLHIQTVINAKGGPTAYQWRFFLISQVLILFCHVLATRNCLIGIAKPAWKTENLSEKNI